jgi:NAD(P)-dependent dehydrogenase (short-subunit alcohol dehydrogenase family)
MTEETRHVVITGAGSGIGRAIAHRFAASNSSLSLLGRRLDPLKESARQCQDKGSSRVLVRSCDIREQEAVDHCVADMASELGPINVFVANSGIGGPNNPGPKDRFDDIISTNVNGTYYCLRAAQKHLAKGASMRHLIVISSILARFGVPDYTGYCASKTALLGLVRALSLELASQGIQVNALCPGWVDTAMARRGIDAMAEAMGISHEEAYAEAMRAVPMGRMSTAEEIANVVFWLSSNDARGITGQALDVNNGAFMS